MELSAKDSNKTEISEFLCLVLLMLPVEGGVIVDDGALADHAVEVGYVLPLDERQLMPKDRQLANLEQRVTTEISHCVSTLSSVESLQTKMKKMRQPLRRLIQPMILRINSVVEMHSMFL